MAAIEELVEALFADRAVLAVPPLDERYLPKAPGDQDGPNQGDHCS